MKSQNKTKIQISNTIFLILISVATVCSGFTSIGAETLVNTNKYAPKEGEVKEYLTVSGVCEMCAERIENATDIAGIKSAVYNLSTQKLSVKYNNKKTSIAKIEDAILKAGHDVNGRKAEDIAYNQLPACCHYRTLEKH